MVQVHVGQQMAQRVPALGRRQPYEGGVTSLREYSHHRRLAGLRSEDRSRILVFPRRRKWRWVCGSERGGLQVGAPPRVGQDLAVGRRRVLHHDGVLVAGRLSEYICVCGDNGEQD